MNPRQRRIRGFCALCRSRCGCVSIVENGRLIALEPDPTHPTGAALCAKGRAAPELVGSPDRILYPLKRTRPKSAPDPGWQRISWDEALETTASALTHLKGESGAESVAFSVTTPSATAISDSILWIERLINAWGSPNWCYATELCNWHKDYARKFTFGIGVPSPDFENTSCVLLWGHNPSATWLAHAQGVLAAKQRGAHLIIVDPRPAGLANKADLWLRIRPGTDGALALGVANVMITERWYDEEFMREWSNGPLLLHPATGRFLTAADLNPAFNPRHLVGWDLARAEPVFYDPESGAYETRPVHLALSGTFDVGSLRCSTAFSAYARLCRQYSPERVAAICWLDPREIRAMAHMLWDKRPVAYYGWTGVGQHTNATQTDRAIALISALTGSFDVPGGNVIFDQVPVNDVRGTELMPRAQRRKAIGYAERPLGPPRDGWITGRDLYDAILTGQPYPIRGLVGFGANLVVSHAEAERACTALAALDFYVHADLFMTPTASFADIILPVASAWEREGLRVGFEVSQDAQSLVQLRAPAIEPLGESRSDTWIVFEMAKRLGLAAYFWQGDITAAYRFLLQPANISPETLGQHPEGVRVPLRTRYRKYAARGSRGFATPSRKVEVYSEQLLDHGQLPLPEFVEPALYRASPSFPLILTCAKSATYCHSQNRNLPRLRRLLPDPLVELNPETATARGIVHGDWTEITTPHGHFRARAALQRRLDPRVVVAQHGWWQACGELGLPKYAPTGPGTANYNTAIRADDRDPVSGAPSHRSYCCDIRRCNAAMP